MPKLTDSQLVILSAAARRKDGTVLPLPRSLKVNKAATTTVLKSLLKKGLIAERPAAADAVHWRETRDGGRTALVIADAGRGVRDPVRCRGRNSACRRRSAAGGLRAADLPGWCRRRSVTDQLC